MKRASGTVRLGPCRSFERSSTRDVSPWNTPRPSHTVRRSSPRPRPSSAPRGGKALSAEWAPEHEAYIRWLATPKPFRKGVRTKTDYARYAGVSRTTLYKWETQAGFARAVEALRAEWAQEMDRLCEEMIALNMQLPGREGSTTGSCGCSTVGSSSRSRRGRRVRGGRRAGVDRGDRGRAGRALRGDGAGRVAGRGARGRGGKSEIKIKNISIKGVDRGGQKSPLQGQSRPCLSLAYERGCVITAWHLSDAAVRWRPAGRQRLFRRGRLFQRTRRRSGRTPGPPAKRRRRGGEPRSIRFRRRRVSRGVGSGVVIASLPPGLHLTVAPHPRDLRVARLPHPKIPQGGHTRCDHLGKLARPSVAGRTHSHGPSYPRFLASIQSSSFTR